MNHRNFSQTTLAAAITNTTNTAITVASGTTFPAAPFIISIDTEAMSVTSTGSGTNWTVTRGYEGSTAATHLNGAAIFHDISAAEADSWTKRVYSVKDYGAIGNGIADDSASFQAAIDAAHAAGGGTVYIPNGTWIVRDLDSYGGVYIEGQSWNALIKKKSDGEQLLVIDSGSATSHESDIRISNCAFEGLSVDVGFSQQHYMMTFGGVEDMVIDHVKMTEFEGDAIQLGLITGALERHNKRVTIRNCYFDGVNKENRQAISILDGDDITIEGNYFTRTSRSDMPGAVDAEPNLDHDIIKNIKIINNSFYDIGGNVAAVCIVLQAQAFVITKYNGFLIEGNRFDTLASHAFWASHWNSTPVINADPFDDIVFSNNKIFNANSAFYFSAVKGVVLENNEFHVTSSASSIASASTANQKCQDVSFRNNVWDRLGTVDGQGIAIFFVERLTLDHDKFIDCGKSDGSMGYGIVFPNGGASSYVSIANTEFSKPNSKMTYAIFVGAVTLTTTNWMSNSVQSGLGNTFPLTSIYGNVVGPASFTDHAIVRADGVTGKLVQNSSATIDDAGTVLSPAFGTIAAYINDDTAFLFTLGFSIAILVICSTWNTLNSIVWVSPSGNQSAGLLLGAGVNVATGILTGTTGTDGKVTVSCYTNGKVYIENRMGSAISFTITALSPIA